MSTHHSCPSLYTELRHLLPRSQMLNMVSTWSHHHFEVEEGKSQCQQVANGVHVHIGCVHSACFSSPCPPMFDRCVTFIIISFDWPMLSWHSGSRNVYSVRHGASSIFPVSTCVHGLANVAAICWFPSQHVHHNHHKDPVPLSSITALERWTWVIQRELRNRIAVRQGDRCINEPLIDWPTINMLARGCTLIESTIRQTGRRNYSKQQN